MPNIRIWLMCNNSSGQKPGFFANNAYICMIFQHITTMQDGNKRLNQAGLPRGGLVTVSYAIVSL